MTKIIRVSFDRPDDPQPEPVEPGVNGETHAATWLDMQAALAAADEPITAFYRVLAAVTAALRERGGPGDALLVVASAVLIVTAFRALISSVAELFHNLEVEQAALEQQLHRRDRAGDDLALDFAALCSALDTHTPIAQLPIRLQMEFESFAERLGLLRPWTRREPNPGPLKAK